MKTFPALAACALLALTACSSEPEDTEPTTNEADEFALRIKGAKTADEPSQTVAPSQSSPPVAQPLAGISNTPYVAGTVADPVSACDAKRFGEYLGREPSAEVRAAILEAARDLSEVRFIAPGGDYVKPDPTNPRLNIMIAVDGIIRDIRCG